MSSAVSSAARRIADVRDSLGEEALRLAYHAAVPVVVDPALLDLLRVNFFLDPPDALPYEIEADLLLSPLFREIGDGLYEMEPDLRNLLLMGLQGRYGTERAQRVAELLEQYTDATSAWHALPELEHAQRLTAASFLNPARAVQWLAANEQGAWQSPGASLGREWYVAMRRRIEDQSTAMSPDEAFVEAIVLLDNADVERRLAGIDFLRTLAVLQERNADDVVSHLCDFIHRQDARSPGRSERITPDIQAALSLIGTLPHGGFELADVMLTGANLSGLDFHGARFTRVTLTRLRATDINLVGAVFDDVTLADSVLDGARLDFARLHFRRLQGVSLVGVSRVDAHIRAGIAKDVAAFDREGAPLHISVTEAPIKPISQPTPSDAVPAHEGDTDSRRPSRPEAPPAATNAETVRIALLGAPASGKTTYLAALRLAVSSADSSVGRWMMYPANETSSQAMTRWSHDLITEHRFPVTTLPWEPVRLEWQFVGDLAGSRFERRPWWRRRRGELESRFKLDLIDVGGELYRPGVDEIRATSAALDHFANAQGIIYLFDPINYVSTRDPAAYLREIVSERLRSVVRPGRYLPHHVSVCITKFDDPAVFRLARQMGLVTSGADGMPRVRDEDAERFFDELCMRRFRSELDEHDQRSAQSVRDVIRQVFHPDRIRYFVTSSIGFPTEPPTNDKADVRLNPDGFANYYERDVQPTIRGPVHPINVLEPLIDLQQRITRK